LKNAKSKILLKIKRTLNTEKQANRGPIFTFSLPGGAAGTSALPSVALLVLLFPVEQWFSNTVLRAACSFQASFVWLLARNFDGGANNNQVSTFKYIMHLVSKASSMKRALVWRFFLNKCVQISPGK